jgi:hypothetical protein
MQPRLEGRGAQQAAGDAGEDQRDVGGAELPAVDCGVVAEAALTKGGGEEGAVGDELADEAEQAAGAAGPVLACRSGLGGWVWHWYRGGHNARKHKRPARVKENIPPRSCNLSGCGSQPPTGNSLNCRANPSRCTATKTPFGTFRQAAYCTSAEPTTSSRKYRLGDYASIDCPADRSP